MVSSVDTQVELPTFVVKFMSRAHLLVTVSSDRQHI